MRPVLTALLTLTGLTGFLACGAGSQTRQLRDAVRREAGLEADQQAVVFRFAGRRAADARLYRLPDLDEVTWRFETPGLVAKQVVGFAPDDDLVWVLSAQGRLVALDLNTGRPRTADSNVAVAIIGPTGTPIYVRADSGLVAIPGRAPQVWMASLKGVPARLHALTRSRALVLTGDSAGRELIIAGAEAPTRRFIPGGPVAFSPWGEVVAVATDSGVVVIDPLRGADDRFVRLRENPVGIAISPAAHRLYVATDAGEIVELERFGLDVMRRMDAPGVDSLRVDARGRYLIASVTGQDSLLVLPLLPDSTGPRRVAGTWGDDLPAIAVDGTLLVRLGNDVVAWADGGRTERGRVTGGAADRWLPADWDPRRPELQVARQEARQGGPAAAPAGSDDQTLYVQVSSTTNVAWAEDLARDLRVAGVRASVLPPEASEEMYRVVVGPFGNREEAEAAGRQLGMPYWIFTQTPSPRAP